MSRYMVLTGDGGEIANGLSRTQAWAMAKHYANQRKEPMFVALPGHGEEEGQEWRVEPTARRNPKGQDARFLPPAPPLGRIGPS